MNRNDAGNRFRWNAAKIDQLLQPAVGDDRQQPQQHVRVGPELVGDIVRFRKQASVDVGLFVDEPLGVLPNRRIIHSAGKWHVDLQESKAKLTPFFQQVLVLAGSALAIGAPASAIKSPIAVQRSIAQTLAQSFFIRRDFLGKPAGQ